VRSLERELLIWCEVAIKQTRVFSFTYIFTTVYIKTCLPELIFHGSTPNVSLFDYVDIVSFSYGGVDLNQARRKNATRETTSTLKAWLYEHRKNPYPTKGEKIMLAIITKMTLTQGKCM